MWNLRAMCSVRQAHNKEELCAEHEPDRESWFIEEFERAKIKIKTSERICLFVVRFSRAIKNNK